MIDWYEPDEDSYTFVDVLKAEGIHGQVVLDLGCSTGFLTNALSGSNFVLSADLNEAALKHFNGHGNLVHTDLLRGFAQEKIDVVIFNPPYVPDYDCPILGGGKYGREVIDRFVESVEVKTVYLLVIEANRPAEVVDRLKERGYSVDVLKVREIMGETIIILRGMRTTT